MLPEPSVQDVYNNELRERYIIERDALLAVGLRRMTEAQRAHLQFLKKAISELVQKLAESQREMANLL